MDVEIVYMGASPTLAFQECILVDEGVEWVMSADVRTFGRWKGK